MPHTVAFRDIGLAGTYKPAATVYRPSRHTRKQTNLEAMAQPKRDPNDPRFWPVRLGGTSGFSSYHRQGKPSPYSYGAVSRKGTLGQHPDRSRTYANTLTDTAKTIDAEAVRAKARIVTLRLLDRLEDAASSMDDKQLPDALKAAGALAIERTATQGTVNIGTLHLAALKERAALRLSNGIEQRATVAATEDAQVVAIDDVSTDNQSPVDGDAGDGDEIVQGTA